MRIRLLAYTILGVTPLSLPTFTMAWDLGACPPGSGQAPCIEVVENGSTYHINGSGQHAGIWYGLPSTGEDFIFQGLGTELSCNLLDFNCSLSWGARMSKCQDSSGDWRIGLKVTSATFSGSFPCVAFAMDGFPWHSKDEISSGNCAFLDNCKNFIRYNQGAPTLTTNLGSINMSVFGIPAITDGHLKNAIFNLGTGANFDLLNQQFLDCNEDHEGCYISTVLTLDNALSIEIH